MQIKIKVEKSLTETKTYTLENFAEWINRLDPIIMKSPDEEPDVVGRIIILGVIFTFFDSTAFRRCVNIIYKDWIKEQRQYNA